MKRSIYFLSFLLVCNFIQIYSIEDEKNKSQSMSLYTSYFIMTETCKACLYACFFDMHKVRNARVACCQCHYNLESMYLWGHCASLVNKPILDKLKNLLWNRSTDELSTFLVTSFQDLRIKCPECFGYHGWYKVDY